jgi:NADPH:quinone reductase-like Zn-dependent oxidoreductase
MRGYRIPRHGGPEVLEWAELPDPRPRADEAVVAVRACALNHLDLWVRNGVEGVRYPLPLVPGSEVAGDVLEVGEAVRGFKAGDPVLVAPGSRAASASAVSRARIRCARTTASWRDRDLRLRRARRGAGAQPVALPRGLDYTQAAALPLAFLTAWHMLVGRARLRPGEDVLARRRLGVPRRRSRSPGCAAPAASSPPPRARRSPSARSSSAPAMSSTTRGRISRAGCADPRRQESRW